jgi:hypothetical protein
MEHYRFNQHNAIKGKGGQLPSFSLAYTKGAAGAHFRGDRKMVRTRRSPEDSTNGTARGCNAVMGIFSGH